MDIKNIITLVISCMALGLSIVTFYRQQIRKKDRLIGQLISVGVSDGDWNTLAEYSISNVGDNQLVIKEVELCGENGGKILKCSVDKVPFILKPSEIAIVNVFYNSSDLKDDDTALVEFGIFSAKGLGYRLPHVIRENGRPPENMWEVFKLKKEHEGF